MDKNNHTPLVSVLIPYYNDEKFLRESIDSVLNNTYKNFELILLNHATTDSCRDIAHSYADSRIKHIDMPYNLGGGSGLLLEEFLKVAKGKYVKLFCADDIMRPTGLETLVNYMEENPDKDFAFGNVQYVDSKGKDLKENFFNKRKGFSINNDEIDCMKLYSKCNISFLPYIGNIIKRDILYTIPINKTFVMLFDMSLWLSLLCKGYKIGYCETVIADYRIHLGQMSANNRKVISSQFCLYEHTVYWKLFLDIKDINIIKKIFSESKYIQYLDDVKDIPFIVAAEMLNVVSAPYSFLNDMLDNEPTRKYLREKFNYGIEDLRQACMKHVEVSSSSIKKKIYRKNIKELSLADLSFLMFRRLFEIITLKPLIRMFKNKDEYNL